MCKFILVCNVILQWMLSTTDTWNLKTVCYTEVSSIQRLYCMHSNLLGPFNIVCYREVFHYLGSLL